ncbi:MAG: thiamine phosphate synthase [Gammaproteobacteria bacterium]|nr:thiamine phosphate synthase [Gammaproteobacteria bacterium]
MSYSHAHQSRLKGLYIINPPLYDPDLLLRQVEAALQGGAAVMQFRDKHSTAAEKVTLALRLRNLCESYDARFIINDQVELAQEVGAHGVHLGQSDTALAQARQVLGTQAIIGISCYNRLELALEAERQGADYVAFGRFFPSRTKPDAVGADLDLLRGAKQVLGIPVAAIGGITAQNALPLVQAAADMLAVIDGVFGQERIDVAARRLSACFIRGKS